MPRAEAGWGEDEGREGGGGEGGGGEGHEQVQQ